MKAVTYELADGLWDNPFDTNSSQWAREMTFRVEDRGIGRFDQAVLCEAPACNIDWLWPGRIPCGRVTLIEGPAGAGKSFVALDLAARLSDDRPWADGTPQAHKGAKAVIICRQDDSADVVSARLETLGARRERLIPFFEFDTVDDEDRCGLRAVSLPFDLPALEMLLERDKSIRLVVLDSLSDLCPGKQALAETIHRLNRVAAHWKLAIVVTLRGTARFDRQGQLVTKGRSDADGARCQWCCVPDPEDRTRRLFLPTLMNYAKFPEGMAFRPGDRRIDWLDEKIDPFDPLCNLSDCARWLKELLAEGEQPQRVIMQLGKESRFSEGQLHRAYHEVQAIRRREGHAKGSRMLWALPERGAVNAETEAISEVGFRNSEVTTEEHSGADTDAGGQTADEVSRPLAAAGTLEREVDEDAATVAPSPVAAANSEIQNPKSQVFSRLADPADFPWSASPSSRLLPLDSLLDGPNNPNQLLRNMKSVKSMESVKSKSSG